jgi:hypothetical protein
MSVSLHLSRQPENAEFNAYVANHRDEHYAVVQLGEVHGSDFTAFLSLEQVQELKKQLAKVERALKKAQDVEGKLQEV